MKNTYDDNLYDYDIINDMTVNNDLLQINQNIKNTNYIILYNQYINLKFVINQNKLQLLFAKIKTNEKIIKQCNKLLGFKIYLIYDNFNDKWLYTNKLNMSINKIKFNFDISHKDLLKETIDIDDFEQYLNISYIYKFILVHHRNTYLQKYTDIFGKDYKILLFKKSYFLNTDNMNNINNIMIPVNSEKIDFYFLDKYKKIKNLLVQSSHIINGCEIQDD